MRHLKALLALILNTLFPPVCVSCKREGDFLCMDCLKSLDKKRINPIYQKTEKDPDLHHLDGVIYALDYAKNPQIQAAIKQLKYRFAQDLAQHFGKLIAEKIVELNMVENRQIILIPVPLHCKRLNYRGFNQAEVIARAVADFTPDAQILPLLDRVRETKQQARLTKDERHENLKNAFRLNKKFVHPPTSLRMTNFFHARGGPYANLTEHGLHPGPYRMPDDEPGYTPAPSTKPLFFLVDDVCTTGSTLENCAQVLKENGFGKVYGLVIARAFK